MPGPGHISVSGGATVGPGALLILGQLPEWTLRLISELPTRDEATGTLPSAANRCARA